MKLRFLLLIISSLLLVNCGTVSPNLNTSGYQTLQKNIISKKDGFNRIFLLEQQMPRLKSWNFANDYYVDNIFIGRLGPGLVTVHKTKKSNVKLEVKHPNGMWKGLAEPEKSPYPYGGRSLDINFKSNKNKYIISYTEYSNFDVGASMLGVGIFHERLKKNGEPYKFRNTTQNSWWKMHDDLGARNKYFKMNPDLESSRKAQGIE
jgi:hypothetical protein